MACGPPISGSIDFSISISVLGAEAGPRIITLEILFHQGVLKREEEVRLSTVWLDMPLGRPVGRTASWSGGCC